MKTLAIDTSTYVMGVAILDGNQLVGEVTTNLKKNHSLRLMPAIESLMKEVGVAPNEFERIVVAQGPGSYTGVRIGVTTAKTLAWSLGISLVGVSSLEVMAQHGYYAKELIVPLIDARRGQIYSGTYRWNGKEVDVVEADRLILAGDLARMLAKAGEDVLLIGQDVSMHYDTFAAVLGEKVKRAPFTHSLPRPAELGRLGQQRSPIENLHAFAPSYLQLAEAEAKWREAKRQDENNG
ncbi:tRNA (adenosine(37)-N6)-threonylcarbamoyltransferase complex dimerization subunit type 1 TsaB [Halalkalibacterium halodurans]|jgi:tRNA threonylcarbamoyladenosine biosynthesis protein TsaB|uniref:Gcp-like domain-containing protein n=1 Tax=Halalkalibacterium halodurans TaxID=86665 RepID=A0A0M0KD94_ALKHA|nr:tRNA (adenosine(37)-N6)-threonylcarbamoyltransferase complex dimerization subunit type 1 TsaB [Halalkalibacterium halodurans]TPE69399.1 tRNA (adenosine(37)-N6)-threonylcarbamoyltransferase complex dimerization subunit type 1 TsaB [Halalkalibacterium halodurans]